MVDQVIDVAIVGGGVSGVYSAWRLKQQFPQQKIVVFEGSDHIGGRLLSVRPPEIPDMVAELGGMRVLSANVQPLVNKLIGDLNQALPKDEQIELYDFPVDKDQNIAYLRGVHLRLAEFISKPEKVPYRLPFLEQGGTPSSLILAAFEHIVPGITAPGLTEAQRRKLVQDASYDGQPLYQWGFWNLLLQVLSGEGYQLSLDAGGYDSTLANWNAADAIPWYLSDFGVAVTYRGFKKGFQEVPKGLAKLFTEAGGDIRLDTQVSEVAWSSEGFTFKAGGLTIQARSLILAMPRRSIDLLAESSEILHEIRELTSSVTGRPLFKLFTTYDQPWWRAAGYTDPNGVFIPVEQGRSVTDLPVRQTYYWPKDDGTAAKQGNAMLMASYDDGDNTGFWDGLRPRRHLAHRLGREVAKLDDPFIGKDRVNEELTWHCYQAPRRMVLEVNRQLATIHGLSQVPEVRNAAFRDWGDDPFGGGWNSWNIGVKSWEVKEKIVKPLDGYPLYICGEAYSDAQGWVEGALETADLMLKKFGIG